MPKETGLNTILPEGWSECRLGDLIEEYRVKSTRQDQHMVLTSSRSGLVPQSEYYGGGRIASRDNVGFHVIPPNYLTYRSRSDDGNFFININDLDRFGIVSHFYPVFRFKDGDDMFFVEYLNHNRAKLGVHSVGSSQKVLSLNALREIVFPLPPRSERLKISEILRTWDEAIAVERALISNARAQKKALVQSLLTGKKRLPGFSGEWRVRKLGDLADLFAGGTPSTGTPEYWGGEIPWMSSGEINLREIYAVQGRVSESGLANSSAKMVPANSVLIALAGQGATRGKVAISRIPLSTNQSVAAAVPSDGLDPDYLFHNLDSRYEELRSLSLGDGGRGGLNLPLLRSVSIPVPAIEEQRGIAAILHCADQQIAALASKVTALRKEKSALMQQLLTGKRRVKLGQREAA